MRRIIIAIAVCMLFAKAEAQPLKDSVGDHGIHFEKHVASQNWPALLAKAKTGNKYIFIDCYASWCVPCKQMEQEVYLDKAVGQIYNKQFICLKIQMDRSPGDKADIKAGYDLAKAFEGYYAINAYPTFLFFDPDGNPVHKVSGYRDVANFIQLAADAKNPEKQYYRILKNFQPGKIDTAELRGLAFSFMAADTALAGKLALDYLERIPEKQLSSPANGELMDEMQDNPRILDVALRFIQNHPLKDNIEFIAALSTQPKVKAWALDHISKLDNEEVAEESNSKLIHLFYSDPGVQQKVKQYLNQLTDEQLYTKVNLSYLTLATKIPDDTRGFAVFFQHQARVDLTMEQKGFAEKQAESAISNKEFKPLLEDAKQSGTAPDFEIISNIIAKKYNADYAERITISGKVSWYLYLVNKKKEDQYWPELLNCRMDQVKKLRYDTSASAAGFCNNFCWSEFFLHSTQKKELDFAVQLMQKVVSRNEGDGTLIDTYACLLYKAGKVRAAIQWEEKASKISAVNNSVQEVEYNGNTILKMKKGEKIWLEKEYING